MRKKRIISFLLTLVMVASLFPTATTYASDLPFAYVTIKDDGVYDETGTKWDTYEGLTFTPATASTPATLTMENCSMEQGPYDQAWTAIRSELTEPLMLLVKGDNALTIDNTSKDDVLERKERGIAIEIAGDLEIVFDTDASLTITGACNGIVAHGKVTIQDKANITMNLKGWNSTAIKANDITITGGNVTAVTKGVDSHDILASNSFTVTGGTVTLGNNASVWNMM